ncbi:MAG: sensor histidine kinase [Deltaproteobacteria bacterium]|nr:MAG: sensor histidine kinase [Deltaproteobacteria bacterium]
MRIISADKKKEGNPVRLVWLITLLSFSVGVFMVYLVWSTLTNIRTERENLFELKENFISIQTKLESSLAKQKSDLANLLEANTANINQERDYHLVNLIQDYRRAVSDPNLMPAFEELDKSINALLSNKNKLTWWASAYIRTVPRIQPAREEVESILNQIFETVDKAEGQQRLERAMKIRQIKQSITDGSEGYNIAIITELSTPNVFSIIRRDITDLVQLSERLYTISEADNLADLKDNKIRTLLARVRMNTQLSEGEKSREKIQLFSLLEDYETAMFGQGYTIDNDHQIIILGYDGGYGLILDQLKMVKERELLHAEADLIHARIETALGEITDRTNTITQQEVFKVETVLGQTWRTMVIIWFVTSIIYAMLAYEIITAARLQIKAIEDSNTELEAMANELKKSEERLHRLSSDLFAVQENERKRISFELHDELGQSMAALKLQVGSIARRLGTAELDEMLSACDEIRSNINQIIENVRRLSRDLSPVVLDDLGLQAAIEYLVNNFSKIYNVKIRFQQTDINHLFKEDSQRIIYRILQEALTNIGKHAQAKNVALVIEGEDRAVRFTVKDDGRGFNVQKTLDQKGAERGMGLEAMSERVRILGGKINIVSRPGIDTTVTFTAPIK